MIFFRPLAFAALFPFILPAGDAPGVLRKQCQTCHGAALKMAGLDLQTRESLLQGGERGPAAVPHDPEKSLIYRFITHAEKPAMPPEKKLSDEEIAAIRQWIQDGLPWDGATAAVSAPEPGAGLAALEERPVSEEERAFWAFVPPRRPRVPGGGGNAIDAFLAQKWREKGLTPAEKADPRTLIRRAYLDLTGLPPAPGDVEAFAADPRPKRWRALVDQLLASPHYGERWGRHWLDLVRYADSGGFERDFDWPNMYHYRDYVVRAFNADKPYDQFIREQIAGDEIAPDDADAQIATGFLRLGPDNNIKDDRTRLDELDDLVSVTTLAFTGLTVGCARCHNHKFDPIPQKDYYQLQSVFVSTKAAEYPLAGPEVVARYEAGVKQLRAELDPFQKARTQLEEPYRRRLFEEKIAQLPGYLQEAWRTPPGERTEGQRLNAAQIEKTLRIPRQEILAIMGEQDLHLHEALSSKITALDKLMPERYPTARVITDAGREPLPNYFLHRGSPDARGSLMKPGIVTVAWRGGYEYPEAPAGARTTHRRRGLAEWLASPENPLTARVMVNRIWQHHFGEGLVRTPSNFGKTGQPPTHPELLDYLALEFVRSGWSIKAMHRLMMHSEAYRMASNDEPANLAIDPRNHFVWRMPRQRLEAEILRDNILAAAGTLRRETGGPAVFPYIDPALFQSSTDRTWKGQPDDDPSTWRRSLYVFTKRSIRYPLFETFDQPDTIVSCDRRNRSIIAPQALLLMNNASVILQAGHFADRLRREAGADPARQVDLAYRIALARPASAEEARKAREYLQEGPDRLAAFCQVLFSLNEFAYRQ